MKKIKIHLSTSDVICSYNHIWRERETENWSQRKKERELQVDMKSEMFLEKQSG